VSDERFAIRRDCLSRTTSPATARYDLRRECASLVELACCAFFPAASLTSNLRSDPRQRDQKQQRQSYYHIGNNAPQRCAMAPLVAGRTALSPRRLPSIPQVLIPPIPFQWKLSVSHFSPLFPSPSFFAHPNSDRTIFSRACVGFGFLTTERSDTRRI